MSWFTIAVDHFKEINSKIKIIYLKSIFYINDEFFQYLMLYKYSYNFIWIQYHKEVVILASWFLRFLRIRIYQIKNQI